MSNSTGRPVLWLGFFLCAATLLLLVSVVNRPSTFDYQNWDDVYYSSLAIQYANDGEWRPAIQPLGLAKSESFYASNPLLAPYATAFFLKIFGPARWTFKLASLVAFILAGLALTWMLFRLELHPIHALVVLFSYYACPWLYFAMNTARAEPLSIACLYLAAFFCVLAIKSANGNSSPAWLMVSGALSVVCTWNHPIFGLPALLPLAFIFSHHQQRDNYGPAVLRWGLGASAMFFALVVWRVLPHLDAWREQFLANAAYTARIHAGVKALTSFESTLPFPLNQLQNLKARFSTLGWPYISWYAGVPVLSLLFLRPTRIFGIVLFLLLAWLAVIEIKTIVLATYIVNVVMAVPICLLLAAPGRLCDQRGAPAMWTLLALVVAATILHSWLVLRPDIRTTPWLVTEQELGRQFRALPPHAIIWGDPAEGMLPAWRQGDTYYSRSFNFLTNIPGVEERLNQMATHSKDYQLEWTGNQWRIEKNP